MWLPMVYPEGFDRETFDASRAKLGDRFGLKASVRDTVWSLLIEATRRNPDVRATAHTLMGHLVQGENKDPAPYHLEAKKARPAQWQAEIQRNLADSSPLQMRVHIQTCNDNLVCEPCREAASRSYSYPEVLDLLPSPANCQNLEGGCRCWLTFELDNPDATPRT